MTYRVLKVALVCFAVSLIGLGVISAMLYWWHTHIAGQCKGVPGASCHSDTLVFVDLPELAVLLLVYFGLCATCSWFWLRMREAYGHRAK